MSDQSALLGLPYIQPAQAQKHVTHNEALRLLDVLVQLAVADQGLTTPPPAPAFGERHVVGDGASGAWAGADRQIALYEDTGWRFLAPKAGWRAEVLSGGGAILFDGTDWITAPAAESVARLGVNATADDTNRLSVTAPATLLNHGGSDHRLKINKAGAPDTASLLFQSGFSGRAEMGLTGSDGFTIKVSPDSAAWNTALAFDPATGHASGTAVQSTPEDTTPGRLLANGAHGLGAATAQLLPNSDANDLPFITNFGQYYGNSTCLNTPFSWAGFINIMRHSTRGAQIALDTLSADEPKMAIRTVRNDQNSPWREVYHRGNAIGTVSQSTGTNTGALIENGSNANGTYVRFADGTQICSHEIALGDITALGSGTWADPYRSGALDWTFPADFVTAPAVSSLAMLDVATGLSRAASVSIRSVLATRVTDVQSVRLCGESTNDPVTVTLTATGRWI